MEAIRNARFWDNFSPRARQMVGYMPTTTTGNVIHLASGGIAPAVYYSAADVVAGTLTPTA